MVGALGSMGVTVRIFYPWGASCHRLCGWYGTPFTPRLCRLCLYGSPGVVRDFCEYWVPGWQRMAAVCGSPPPPPAACSSPARCPGCPVPAPPPPAPLYVLMALDMLAGLKADD